MIKHRKDENGQRCGHKHIAKHRPTHGLTRLRAERRSGSEWRDAHDKNQRFDNFLKCMVLFASSNVSNVLALGIGAL